MRSPTCSWHPVSPMCTPYGPGCGALASPLNGVVFSLGTIPGREGLPDSTILEHLCTFPFLPVRVRITSAEIPLYQSHVCIYSCARYSAFPLRTKRKFPTTETSFLVHENTRFRQVFHCSTLKLLLREALTRKGRTEARSRRCASP